MNNNECFSVDYSYFFNIWPWMGLGAAVVVLTLLFCTDWLRGDTAKSRWRDPFWLGWAFMVCYMLHNVEEYGFDLTGAHNGFPSAMAVIFGQPLAEYFFLTVNFSIVWIAAPLAAWIGRKKNWPVLATGMAGLMFINGFTHIISGFVGGYNPGLLTTLVIFIPITFWTFIRLLRQERYAPPCLLVEYWHRSVLPHRYVRLHYAASFQWQHQYASVDNHHGH